MVGIIIRNKEVYRIVNEVKHSILVLNKKMNRVLQVKNCNSLNDYVSSLDILLSLPLSLRKTLLAIVENNGKGIASEISSITGRARAIESRYLNELVLRGFLNKQREGMNVVFRYILEIEE